jgi:hypothetical protein
MYEVAGSGVATNRLFFFQGEGFGSSYPRRWTSQTAVVSVWVDTFHVCQSILTDMDIENLSLNLSSDDPAIGLRASLALHRLAERVEANHVALAREKGWSWRQIGDALGITRQSVHTKYNKESS